MKHFNNITEISLLKYHRCLIPRPYFKLLQLNLECHVQMEVQAQVLNYFKQLEASVSHISQSSKFLNKQILIIISSCVCIH